MSEPTEFVDYRHLPDEAFEKELAYFDAAPAAPESYVQQHQSNDDCWCEPYPVGTLGVWTHRVVEE